MSTHLPIDSRLLASVEDLPLLARTVVEGFLDGLHRSPFLGYSTEFASYRQYVQGDNLRHLDWKVWARSDALYIKQFEDDTNYRGQIYLDTSASMDFGTGPAHKFTFGRLLAAALAHLMIPSERHINGLALALEDLSLAHKLEPDNGEVLHELKRARGLQRQVDQKQQGLFTKMIGTGELV